MSNKTLSAKISNPQGVEEYLRELLIEACKENTPVESAEQLKKVSEKDLLHYIRVMQHAIIPKSGLITELFPQSFIYNVSKENISGDFYWVEQVEERIFIAVADCKITGVTGAMMSLVCASTLNRVLNEFKIKDTGKMLDKMQELIRELLKSPEYDNCFEINISLCCINKITCVLEWSGAHNNLFYVHNGIIEEISMDSNPIEKGTDQTPFTKHKMYLSKGDMIYLFTDGFTNQVGGENEERLGKKCFREILLRISPLSTSAQKDILQKKFESWKYNLEQSDDVLVIGTRL